MLHPVKSTHVALGCKRLGNYVAREEGEVNAPPKSGAGGGSRTPTGVATRQILSLVRLPIPPLRLPSMELAFKAGSIAAPRKQDWVSQLEGRPTPASHRADRLDRRQLPCPHGKWIHEIDTAVVEVRRIARSDHEAIHSGNGRDLVIALIVARLDHLHSKIATARSLQAATRTDSLAQVLGLPDLNENHLCQAADLARRGSQRAVA